MLGGVFALSRRKVVGPDIAWHISAYDGEWEYEYLLRLRGLHNPARTPTIQGPAEVPTLACCSHCIIRYDDMMTVFARAR